MEKFIDKKNQWFYRRTMCAKKKFTRWNILMELFRRSLAEAFGVILFQLSVTYRRNNFIGDVTVEVVFAVIFFNSLECTDGISLSITPSIIIK
jgi:hypothetical protein